MTGTAVPAPAGIAQHEGTLDSSPTLRAQIKQLEDEGWIVEYVSDGRGNRANYRTRRIEIQQSDRGSSLAKALAHEIGHAMHPPSSSAPSEGLTSEGYALLNEYRISQEIRNSANASMDFGVSLSEQTGELYNAANSGRISWDKAASDLGEIVADNLRPQSCPSITYREYYNKGGC